MTTAAEPKAVRSEAFAVESPLGALRLQIATRVAELRSAGADLERHMLEAAAQRANVLQHLRQNEDNRRKVLGALATAPPREIVRALHDGLALTAQLGLIGEQARQLQQRLGELLAERALLVQVAEALGRVAAEGGIDVDQRAARQSQAIRHIFQFVDDEHDAAATAILDGPMQRLSDAAFDAELVGHALGRDLAAATEAAQRCRVATAAAATGLEQRIQRMSPIHTEQSLVQALRELLNDSPAAATARLRIIGAEWRLPLLSEISAYRIVEEAADNAARHGHATHIDVVLSFHRDRLVIVIKDDGDGFDLVATEARLGRTRALGLIEMKERAALAGGRCEVRSVSGAGSEVRVTLPAVR